MSETIGFGGYPAAGILGETPELVSYDRKRGYPWPPFTPNPDKYIVGASSVGKPAGQDWEWWTRRVTARWAAKHRAEIAEIRQQDAAAKWIEDEAKAEQFRAAEDGSLVHSYTAFEDAGRPQQVDLPKHLRSRIDAWWEFKELHGVRIGAIERTGYGPDAFGFGVAGTFDRIVVVSNPPDGVPLGPNALIGLDIKVKSRPVKDVKPDITHLVQGVALSHSTHIAIEERSELFPLPSPIRCFVIVYLCTDGYRAHWINPNNPELVSFTGHCVAVSHMKKSINGGAFGTPEVRTIRAENLPQVVPMPDSSQAGGVHSPGAAEPAGTPEASGRPAPEGASGTTLPSKADYIETLKVAGHKPAAEVRLCARCNLPLPEGSHGRRKYHGSKKSDCPTATQEEAA